MIKRTIELEVSCTICGITDEFSVKTSNLNYFKFQPEMYPQGWRMKSCMPACGVTADICSDECEEKFIEQERDKYGNQSNL